MKYCSLCGSQDLIFKVPSGDSLPRYICGGCETIHYVNPKIIVGAIPTYKDQILLCKRAIEPRKGKWTLPCGYMENGETVEEGAARETLEEANARIVIKNLQSVYSIPYINQVYLVFNSELLDLDFSAGEESLEVELFNEEDIPWSEIAFSAIKFSLETFLQDRKEGNLHITRVGRYALNKKDKF
ncbi:NUDIX hydrolase [Leptospira sp. GIMC2001]|uniref:NUDIX hydrolase n=1 Tax=Leptospira sp. GIMC2001 TaxID=1513297 RepID=UPI00234BA886|nr:NUDIX hydrolase [Leptospira sp. GIMC2001]WCL49607.1 NUDIX hydrolase [Leptospira sp. GIMC2001]